MTPSRFLSLNALAVALGSLATASPGGRIGQAIPAQPTLPPRELRRVRARARGYLPHQNLRECARRVGGEVWQDYKNARRVWRGLDPR